VNVLVSSALIAEGGNHCFAIDNLDGLALVYCRANSSKVGTTMRGRIIPRGQIISGLS
jgi:hypothetical protein